MKCNGLHMAELNKDMGLSVRMVKKFEIVWQGLDSKMAELERFGKNG